MSLGPLVDAQWLRDHLGDARVRVVDCRWKLGQPGAGRAAYLDGHIPGAAFLDLDDDLSDPPGESGRHPLPDARRFEAAARGAGVGDDAHVVAYDESGEGGAARLWWLLRHFGHDEVALLDGGLAAWREAGGALAPGEERPPPGDFTARERTGDTASPEEIESSLADGSLRLLDARAPDRYAGRSEPIDPVAGHIPGAANAPFSELAPSGRYLPAAELRELLPGDGPFVAYCGSGVSACTALVAAEVAGISARLYPGSWSEWCARGGPASTEDEG
jgi:thiosulfate/3-mercaptopyruvate sulfurtransferase